MSARPLRTKQQQCDIISRSVITAMEILPALEIPASKPIGAVLLIPGSLFMNVDE